MVTRQTSRRYEELQLQLIVQEYERQKFDVVLDYRIPKMKYIFDARAERKSDGKVVFIELLNSHKEDNMRQGRVTALEQAARAFPDATIDFRYLDREAAPYHALVEQGARPAKSEDLAKLLTRKLPSKKSSPIESSFTLLELWCLHVLTLRAFASSRPNFDVEAESVLDVYNLLLQHGFVNAPEQKVNGIELDLFQIHEAVLSATQGAIVEATFADQLRKHVKSVRRQIRRTQKQGG